MPRFGGALIRRPSGYGLALPVRTLKPEYINVQQFCMENLPEMWYYIITEREVEKP